jgi:hypothetical protein
LQSGRGDAVTNNHPRIAIIDLPLPNPPDVLCSGRQWVTTQCFSTQNKLAIALKLIHELRIHCILIGTPINHLTSEYQCIHAAPSHQTHQGHDGHGNQYLYQCKALIARRFHNAPPVGLGKMVVSQASLGPLATSGLVGLAKYTVNSIRRKLGLGVLSTLR